MASNTATPSQDFLTAWRDTFTRHRDLMTLLNAVIAATQAGAHPAALTDIATRLGRTPEETERLFTDVAPVAAAWARMWLHNGMAHLDLTTDNTTPRFRYHVGGQSFGADGCAPDVFLVAFALREPFHVESACPVTGTPIRVEFGAAGVTGVDPPATVVAAIHPHTAPEAFLFTDPGRIDADICLHQPFFASADAASGWLAAHPGGRVLPPSGFYREFDQLVGGYPLELVAGVVKDRITSLSTTARQLHQRILRGFAIAGAAPSLESVLLKELHELDVIRLDADGTIRAAYPFSGTPTAHRVNIDGGPQVYAMCAIDALGMAAMLGRDVTITSADPVTAAPVAVSVSRHGYALWDPDTTVVFAGSGPTASAAAADRCCGVMNFFTGTDTVRTWLAANPHVSGVVLTGGQALRLGTDIFGDLLESE